MSVTISSDYLTLVACRALIFHPITWAVGHTRLHTPTIKAVCNQSGTTWAKTPHRHNIPFPPHSGCLSSSIFADSPPQSWRNYLLTSTTSSKTANLWCIEDSLTLETDPITDEFINKQLIYGVGRICAEKILNKNAIKGILGRAWQPCEGLVIDEMGLGKSSSAVEFLNKGCGLSRNGYHQVSGRTRLS